MPELPEVETVRRGLSKRLINFNIEDLEVCRDRAIASPGGSAIFVEQMKGVTIGKWERRGKYLLADLKKSPNNESIKKKIFFNWGSLVVHLRMTGNFQWHKNNTPPCPHTRVRFWNKKGEELRFVDIRSFGQMWWIPSKTKPEEIIKGLKTLGPEPFSKNFNPIYLKSCLKGRTRSIKSSLLDQSVVAGTGNIYADETLFAAGILPYKNSSKLTNIEIKKVCEKLEETLLSSIKEGGTTFKDFRNLEGLNGNYGEQAWVYRRTNRPCLICGTSIERKIFAGRSTHWCPNCQK